MIVIKFGGTSVGDTAAVQRAAGIVAERVDRKPIVVVSALGGVTSALITMAYQAARGQIIGAIRCVEGLRERHLETARALLSGASQSQVAGELSDIFDELEKLAHALSVLAHLTPRSLDTIAAAGERASSLLVAAAFGRWGTPLETLALSGGIAVLVAALTHILTLDGNLHFTVRSESGEVIESATVSELIERVEAFK